MVQAEVRVRAKAESKLGEPREYSPRLQQVRQELLLESRPCLLIQNPYTIGRGRPQGEPAPKTIGGTHGGIFQYLTNPNCLAR